MRRTRKSRRIYFSFRTEKLSHIGNKIFHFLFVFNLFF